MRCRRKWNLGSYTRQNYEPIRSNDKLYFGSAFHFALEDFHGYKMFESAALAFMSFIEATPNNELPPEWEDLIEIGVKLLDYYEFTWLEGRDTIRTVWIDGVPQVEVNFAVPLFDTQGNIVGIYKGIFDCLVMDAYDRFWVRDFKTAKQISSAKLENDLQATGYTWANRAIFGVDVAGMLYQQHLKTPPTQPQELKAGGLSKNKNIASSYRDYRQALIDHYGKDKVPWAEYQELLSHLLSQETEHSDRFVRRDFVYRSDNELLSFEKDVAMMVEDMFNPNVRIYPNPTRDCSWDCDFLPVCLAMNDGSDWEAMLSQGYRVRLKDAPSWRDTLEIGGPNG